LVKWAHSRCVDKKTASNCSSPAHSWPCASPLKTIKVHSKSNATHLPIRGSLFRCSSRGRL
jgi:hypothetical protein